MVAIFQRWLTIIASVVWDQVSFSVWLHTTRHSFKRRIIPEYSTMNRAQKEFSLKSSKHVTMTKPGKELKARMA
jgi:hypothetical protein